MTLQDQQEVQELTFGMHLRNKKVLYHMIPNPSYIGNYYRTNVQKFINNHTEEKNLKVDIPSGWSLGPGTQPLIDDIVPSIEEPQQARVPKSCNDIPQINRFDDTLKMFPVKNLIIDEVSRGGLNTSNYAKDNF